MTYHIGQRLPIDRTRGIFGETIDPTWFILVTPAQKEKAAKPWLERNGALEVWYPVTQGWRKVPRGNRRQVPYDKLVAPRYVFMHTDKEVHWDVLFEAARGRVSGVVGYHETPLAISEETISNMAMVPERIEALRLMNEAERLKRLEALRPREGEKAKLTVGPLAGWIVDIARIDAGIAHFVLGSIPGTAAVETLERGD